MKSRGGNIVDLFRKKKTSPATTPAISETLDTNVQQLKKDLGEDSDFLLREITLGGNSAHSVAIVHIDGVSDEQRVIEGIIEPLQEQEATEAFSLDWVMNEVTISGIKKAKSWNEAIFAILCGDTAIFINGSTEVLIAATRGGQSRSISEPTTETVIRGPKDCFTESIRTNTSLIRQRIRSSHLRIEGIVLGEVTQTDIALVYMDDIVEPSLLKEIQDKIKQNKFDAIMNSEYLEEILQNNIFSPFPTVLNTERPDVVVGNILEGRVAILVHGTPFTLVAPATLTQFMQSPEDYSQHTNSATFIRFLRVTTFGIAILAPALYVAITTHHQEMMPTTLAISLAAQREGIPFPTILEAIMMEFTFEILREAGVRMPRAVGQAVSIVGALVLGQAAVQAGLVSAAMVIVVALTAISSFTFPHYSISVSTRLLRFLFMLAGAFIGLLGISLGLLILLTHLVTLESFGIAYLSPITPFIKEEQKDTFFRLPFQFLKTKPLPAKQSQKQKDTISGDSNEKNNQ